MSAGLMSAGWEAVRSTTDRRKVSYWRLTTRPGENAGDSRKASLGAVSRSTYDAGAPIDGWFRAVAYDWNAGNPARQELGYFPTKFTAQQAVEAATQGRREACSRPEPHDPHIYVTGVAGGLPGSLPQSAWSCPGLS